MNERRPTHERYDIAHSDILFEDVWSEQDASACPECGHEAQGAVSHCPACGARIDVCTGSCSSCGARVCVGDKPDRS